MRLPPTFLALLALILGIVAAALTGMAAAYWLVAVLAALAAGMMGYLFNRSGLEWLILICLVAGGGFIFRWARQEYLVELHFNQRFDRQVLAIRGVALERPATTPYGYRFLVQLKPEKSGLPRGRVTVYSRNHLPEELYGHRLILTGRFKATPGSIANWPEWLELRRISGSINLTQPLEKLPGFGLPFYYDWADRLRRAMLQQGRRELRPKNAALLHGMIFGERLAPDPANRRLLLNLRRTGTIHLLSVSGLHIGFAVYSISLLLGLLRVPPRWRLIPLGLGIGFYIMMTGMEPPVLRAGVMLLCYLVGELLGSGDSPLNRLSLAGLVLLLLNPYNLWEIGFQLSFAATLGVVWLYPLLKEYFPARHPWMKPVWQGLLLSGAAQLLLLPVLVFYFQQVSWSAPLVNLLLLVPAAVVVVGGLAAELVASILPLLGAWLLAPVDWAISLTSLIVNYCGSLPWAAGWLPRWPWPWMVGYYLGLLLLLDAVRPNRLTRKRHPEYAWLILLLLLGANLMLWGRVVLRAQGDYLQVSFIDVGQGDAILLRAPDGASGLIDSGSAGYGQARVLPRLRAAGVERLDWVLLSHGHPDHLGGLPEVLTEIPTGRLYFPANGNNRSWRHFWSVLKPLKLKRSPLASGVQLRLGRSVRGTVFQATAAAGENDRSLTLLITYGKNRLCLTGDLGFEGEAILIKDYPQQLQTTVLKIGHHGSNQATSSRWLLQLRPKLAVISVGADNRFGHPGRRTLNRLRSMGIPVYRTDRQGQIDLRVYQTRFLISTAKEGW